MVGMLKVNLHNMFYYTLFNFSRYSNTPVRYYNSLIKRLNKTDNFKSRFKQVKSFPEKFPVSREKFNTLNKLLILDETMNKAVYDIKKLEMRRIINSDKDIELIKSIYQTEELEHHECFTEMLT